MKAYRFTSPALSELKQATLHYEGKEDGLGGVALRMSQHDLLGFFLSGHIYSAPVRERR